MEYNHSHISCLPKSDGVNLAPEAIILAAGKGTRMGGDLPKVIYQAAGQPMVLWVVRACLEAGISRCIVVVGHQGEKVKDALAGQDGCVFVEQSQQLGTGHAAKMAGPLFADRSPTDVIVLPGDGPLISPDTLTKLLETHRAALAAATLATAILDDPTGYGRVIRSEDGTFQAIVEHKDADDQQKKVREINTGYYCFRSDLLFQSLSRIKASNAQKEYYLPDVPSLLKNEGETVIVVDALAPEEVLGVNDPQQLAQVDKILRSRAG